MLHDPNTPMGPILANQLKANKVSALQKRTNDMYNAFNAPPPPGRNSKYDDIAPRGPNRVPPKIIPKGAGRNDGF